MLKIVFRADASLLIGKGHIMRCLTLADEIKTHQDDADITFITTPHTGNLDEFIVKQGYKVTSLPPPLANLDKNNTATWLGRTQQEDATACQAKLTQHYDIIIIDHYAIDIKWHRLIRPYCQNIMVIDDLANRPHDCDILLDQTLSRNKLDYKKLTPTTCSTLAGESYTLLRKEFYQYRIQAKEKRKKLRNLPNNFHVLVSLGGFDIDNISQLAINALKTLHNSSLTFTATLILSSQSKHLASLKSTVDSLSWLTLELDCATMSEQMLKADIAIGASGATAWERCCLGLPSLSIETASNQKWVSSSLAKRGAIINLGNSQRVKAIDIIDAFNKLLVESSEKNIHMPLYQQSIKSSFACIDGEGSKRVYHRVINIIKPIDTIVLKPAVENDIDIIFNWQSNANIRRFSRNTKPIEYQEHCQWFKKAISSNKRKIYLIHTQQRIVGMLRLDHIDDLIDEISILVDPNEQGKGFALSALKALETLALTKTIEAFVREDNIASHKLFQSAKFKKISATKYCLFPPPPKEVTNNHAR